MVNKYMEGRVLVAGGESLFNQPDNSAIPLLNCAKSVLAQYAARYSGIHWSHVLLKADTGNKY